MSLTPKGIGRARGEDHHVGDVFLDVEGCGTRDVGAGKDGAGAVASGDVGCGCVGNAHEGAGNFKGNIPCMKEPRVIAAMPKEELMFEASVRVRDGTVLRLEDGVDVLVKGDDVEPHEEIVVQQSNDMLHSGEGLPGASIKHCSIFITQLVEHDECSGCGDERGCRGEPGGMQDCVKRRDRRKPVSRSFV
jgi:hypothetical protein